MDWKKTFNRGQWLIHAVFLVAILMGSGITMLALRLNHLQNTQEERNIKINSLLTGLKEDHPFDKIGKLLTSAQSDKANDKIKWLAGRVAETEELLEIKASADLGGSIRTFNKLVGNISEISQPDDVLKVMNQKVNQLRDIARSQHYKNVGIIADRMAQRLSTMSAETASVSPHVAGLKADLKRLSQLISSSSLSPGEKNTLTNRIEGMEHEIETLVNLSSHSKDLKSHVNKASIALAQWLLDAEKKAKNSKGFRETKQNQLVIFLASLVAFMASAWLGMAYLFRWQKVRIGNQVEMEVKSVIEKGIMADQRFMMDHYSDLTRNDIIKLLDELKVKLNLGTMLHDGLPFAGCMIDNQFKVTWNNQLFLEQFYLSDEEVRSEGFNWDFLRECLNLEIDPVYEALVNKQSGIYPVKIKQDEMTPMQPYEMYVTPITVNREDRVMVFFYPLVSVKDAIVEQVNLAKDALGRFAELWREERLDENELSLLSRDFKNNDLVDIFGTLTDLHDKIEQEKKEQLETISSLENENMNYHVILDVVKRIEHERKDIIKSEFNLVGELKTSFISTIDRSDSLLQINRSILQQNDELRTEASRMVQYSQETAKKSRETIEIMSQLEGVKTDYKKLKLELLEVKAKLISINTSLMGQLPPLDDHQQKLALRYKDELARLDFNVVTLDKKLSQLDLILGKLSMMHSNPVQQTTFNFQTTQKDHEMRDTLTGIQKALNAEEARIVEYFTTLHQYIRQDMTKTAEATAATQINPQMKETTSTSSEHADL